MSGVSTGWKFSPAIDQAAPEFASSQLATITEAVEHVLRAALAAAGSKIAAERINSGGAQNQITICIKITRIRKLFQLHGIKLSAHDRLPI